MPKTDFRKKLGDRGEILACQFLLGKGYTLVQKNFLICGGQIDLIMYSPQGNLVFVEVKTRRAARQPETRPEIRIGPLQLLAIRRAARRFLAANKFPFASWQLDLIWIHLEPDAFPSPQAKIKHYQNILET